MKVALRNKWIQTLWGYWDNGLFHNLRPMAIFSIGYVFLLLATPAFNPFSLTMSLKRWTS